METIQNGFIKQVNSMSMFMKALLVGGLSLLLLIPLMMTSALVDERKDTANSAIQEVTEKWGRSQSILAPMLRIPYNAMSDDNKVVTKYLWLTPKTLNIAADVSSEERKRGIYRVPVYTSELVMDGEWDLSVFEEEHFTTKALRLSEAKVFLGLHDVKGFKDYVHIAVSGTEYALRSDKSTEVSTSSYDPDEAYTIPWGETPRLMPSLLSSALPLDEGSLGRTFSFQTHFTFTGSKGIHFATPGRSTQIHVKSNWAHPSFAGSFLPEKSEITKDGFDAHWTVVEYNRGYGNLLSDEDLESVMSSTATVNFVQPVNEYSQTDRSIKYGILVILLSFVSIFFIEMSLKKLEVNVNLFHYMLVGLALILFYTLLLSMSEIIGFGWAYCVASVMTIGLIGLYFRSLLPSGSSALILVGILAFLYLFMYMLIQLTTYALLVGSLGLFVILALVMYVSSRLIK